MKKVLGILFIVLLLAAGQNYFFDTLNVAHADFNGDLKKFTESNNHLNIFKSFFKQHDKDEKNQSPKNNKFMLKGAITASSSSSLTISNQTINIDSSITGGVKIVGNIQTGAYAMVQGVIQNSNYYATKIIVDQRNNHEENKEDEKLTPTPTETITPILSPTPVGTQSATIEESIKENSSIQNIISMLRNLLTSLQGSISKI